MLILVAGTQNNLIRNDPQYLMKVMRLSEQPDLTPLFNAGFLLASRKHHASKVLATCKQNARPERETEYSETETKKKPLISPLPDTDWLKALETDPAYTGLPVTTLIAKCRVWCETNHKAFSKRRIVNWLNRQEKPLTTALPTRTSRDLSKANPDE